jgi:hypothetical protein
MHEFFQKKNMMNGWMLKKDVRIGSKILKTLDYYY